MALKLPKALTADEVAALMAMPNITCPTGLRDRALLELMRRAGLRVGEVCGLHVRDIDWREGEVHLRAEVAKGGREAVLPLDPIALGWLERWKAVRRKYAAGKPHLFTTLKGGPLDRRAVWAMVNRRSNKAGIRHAHPHMLRHTFATELLREGFTIAEVQKLMRHADLRTTAVYLHVVDRDLARKIRSRL